MRKQIAVLTAAAAMTIGGIGFSPSTARAEDPAAKQSADVAGRELSPAAKDVRDTISQATSAAVQGKFEDAAKRFSEADRKRLGDQFKDNTTLRDGFTQFNNDWKAKYNQDFDSDHIETALSDGSIKIYQGDLTERAQTAGERMSPDQTTGTSSGANSGAFSDNAQPKGSAQTGSQNDARAASDRDASAMNDKDFATIYLPASHNMPPVSVAMHKESGIGDTWKIEVPDSLNAQELSDSLTRHVKMAVDQKSSWPADVNDAYRMVTHHVLEAFSEASGAMNQTGTYREHTGSSNAPGNSNAPEPTTPQ